MLQKTFGSPSLKNIDVAIPPNDTVFRQLPKLSFRLLSVDVYIHAFRYMMAIKCGVLGAASQVITDNFRLINDSALSPRIYGFCISFFIRKHNVVVYGTEFIELTKIFYFGLRHSIFAWKQSKARKSGECWQNESGGCILSRWWFFGSQGDCFVISWNLLHNGIGDRWNRKLMFWVYFFIKLYVI